jgi:hypothetical protein
MGNAEQLGARRPVAITMKSANVSWTHGRLPATLNICGVWRASLAQWACRTSQLTTLQGLDLCLHLSPLTTPRPRRLGFGVFEEEYGDWTSMLSRCALCAGIRIPDSRSGLFFKGQDKPGE